MDTQVNFIKTLTKIYNMEEYEKEYTFLDLVEEVDAEKKRIATILDYIMDKNMSSNGLDYVKIVEEIENFIWRLHEE